MRRCVVERDGKRDLGFVGEVLAEASSRRWSEPSELRWTEITICRTEDGRYVVAVVGRTCWQGEKDRFSAEVCDTAEAVLAALERLDEAGETYLYHVAKCALEAAAEADPAFAAVLLQRVE